MSTGSSRPGGLTALAVLNFVFGGLGAIGVLGMFAIFALINAATDGEALAKLPNMGALMFALAVSLVGVVLLITSGVGYLGQKKFLGRMLGNAYGGVALANVGISLTLMKQEFGIMIIIGLIYPVLTLALLNTTFKDDFINP